MTAAWGLLLGGAALAAAWARSAFEADSAATNAATADSVSREIVDGQQILHLDTLGGEPFWNDSPLQLGEVVEETVVPTPALNVRHKGALRGSRQHSPSFHDVSAATLAAVVEHYDRVRTLKLTAPERQDLIEYRRSQ